MNIMHVIMFFVPVYGTTPQNNPVNNTNISYIEGVNELIIHNNTLRYLRSNTTGHGEPKEDKFAGFAIFIAIAIFFIGAFWGDIVRNCFLCCSKKR